LSGKVTLVTGATPGIGRTRAIIDISAASGTLAIQGRPAYQASKGATNSLTRQLAVDYGKQNIRSNAIVVGFTDTGCEESRQIPTTSPTPRSSSPPTKASSSPES